LSTGERREKFLVSLVLKVDKKKEILAASCVGTGGGKMVSREERLEKSRRNSALGAKTIKGKKRNYHAAKTSKGGRKGGR